MSDIEKSLLTPIFYHPECMDFADARRYFTRLRKDIPWIRMEWKAGRFLPRMTHRYDIPSGTKITVLEELISSIEETYEVFVQGVFCNLYLNGNHYTPSHQDSYDNAHVFTLSFGATRDFYFKDIKTGEETHFELANGDLIYFSPDINRTHKHCLPKSPNQNGERISIVFFTTEPYCRNRIRPLFDEGMDLVSGTHTINTSDLSISGNPDLVRNLNLTVHTDEQTTTIKVLCDIIGMDMRDIF